MSVWMNRGRHIGFECVGEIIRRIIVTIDLYKSKLV